MHDGSWIVISKRRTAALLCALTVATLLSAAVPNPTDGAQVQPLGDILQEFNAICTRIEVARADLHSGWLGEDAFLAQVLELFARADSMTTLLHARFPVRSQMGPVFALDRALKHLRDSLRENYAGIVEKNGYRFVTADAALKAAEAWRSGATDTGSSLP